VINRFKFNSWPCTAGLVFGWVICLLSGEPSQYVSVIFMSVSVVMFDIIFVVNQC